MERITIPTGLIIDYLSAILAIDPANPTEPDIDLIEKMAEFLSYPKDEWDTNVEFPEQILEIIILEELLFSKNENMEMREIMDEYYFPYLGTAFFDPDPEPNLTITGWINYNYGQQYEEKHDVMPPVSLFPALEAVKCLVKSSPTCDETLTDHISDRYLELSESGDEDARLIYFYNEGADLIYELSKCIVEMRPHIRKLYESYDDELPSTLGYLLLSDLVDDFIPVFDGDNNADAIRYHPLTLVDNLVDDLNVELN